MNRSGKLHALLSTARVANIPSVVSNVWLGVALGAIMTIYSDESFDAPWLPVASLAIAGVLLYAGGNFFNDWMDRFWDARHRPERALPRELFAPGLYLSLAVCLMGAGAGLAWTASLRSGLVTGGIVFWIVIYTVWHKRSAWAVVPMGMCRALLPVMGFMALSPYSAMIVPVACALFFYIMGLSLSARYESMKEPPKRVAVLARGLLLAAAVMMALGNKSFALDPLPSICGVLPYLAWTGFCLKFRRKPVPELVSGLLAGIPLVDWILLMPLYWTIIAQTSSTPPFAIATLLIPPLAFISALLLQRLAPAT